MPTVSEIKRGALGRRQGVGRPPVYPWREMALGDSFEVDGITRGGISSLAYLASKRMGGGVRFRITKHSPARFTVRRIA